MPTMRGRSKHLDIGDDARPKRKSFIDSEKLPNHHALITEARRLGQARRLANLRFLIDMADNVSLSMSDRMSAVVQIEDRYGQPRQAVQIAAALEVEPTALVELVGYAPPPGWDGDAPSAPTDTPDLTVVEGNGNAPIEKVD